MARCCQMILQVAADTLTIQHGFDAERRQPFLRADAGAMQHLRRSNRPGAKDYFAPLRPRFDDLAVLAEAHADRAAVLDDHLVDQHVGLQPQIWPRQCRLQKTARRGPAPAALLIDVEVSDALVVAGVEIRRFADSHFMRGLGNCIKHLPGQSRGFDPPAAADAVMFAFAKEMIFKLLEGREHVVPAPAGQPELPPVVVIRCLSAHRDHGVDCR